MRSSQIPSIEYNFARCRLLLSTAALCAVYLDPTPPLLSERLRLVSGPFVIDPLVLAIMGTHLTYSLLLMLRFRTDRPRRAAATLTAWVDLLFAAAIAAVTEGSTSPFFVFFVFAVMEAGLSAGLRQAMLVTGASVGLYLGLIAISGPANASLYLIRIVYIAILGYLVGYFGQQRLNLEAGLRELAAASERRQIARDLHDTNAQALAGISLRLDSCQELLTRGRSAEASAELADLRRSVDREFDDLRGYTRSLAGLDATPTASARRSQTRFTIDANIEGPAQLIDAVLLILCEGIRNVTRHARASVATLRARSANGMLQIAIDDDGVGFATPTQQPWSIASRVRELGGVLERQAASSSGTHLRITIPTR